MSREFKPGDVAMIEVGCHANRHVGMFAGDGWRYGDARWAANDPAIVTARPLIVIDPEDREQAERLADAIEDHCGVLVDSDQVRDTLRSLIAPPKPDEPTGLGAVVEDGEGRRFVRVATDEAGYPDWKAASEVGDRRSYADIRAVRVLSEGVL